MWKSRLLYIGALLCVLMLLFGYQDKALPFTMLYALLIMAALSLLSVLTAPLFLRIEQPADRQVALKGETFFYTARVRNRGPLLYPQLRYVFHSTELVRYDGDLPVSGSLRPGARINIACRVTFPYRGVYELGLQKIVVTDILGLFRWTIRARNPLTVVVYPESRDGFSLPVPGEPQSSSYFGDTWNEDYTSVADVRKYEDSDSMRRIHWKLSAKRGELIVKDYLFYEPDRVILLVDTQAIPLPAAPAAAFEDTMMSYAASAIEYCFRARLPVLLRYGIPGESDLRAVPVDMAGDHAELYTLLAGIAFRSAHSDVTLLPAEAGAYTLVALLSSIDAAMHDRVRSLVSFDHNIILYYFVTDERPLDDDSALLLDSLRAYGASVFVVEFTTW